MVDTQEMSRLYDRLYDMIHEYTDEVKENVFNFNGTFDSVREYRKLKAYLKQDLYYKSIIDTMEAINELNKQIKIRLNIIPKEEDANL